MLTLLRKVLLITESFWYLHRWDKTIRQKPFQQWQKHLNSASFDATEQANLSTSDIQLMRKAIDSVVRRSSRELNCMRRCLALKSMIERRKGQCTLHIGVKIQKPEAEAAERGAQQSLFAHAWLSVNGVIINDTPESTSEYQEITHSNALFAQAASAPMR
jgi:hypothetical protein